MCAFCEQGRRTWPLPPYPLLIHANIFINKFFVSWCEMRFAPKVHNLLIDLSLRRIGMDRAGDGLRSGASFHEPPKTH